ncbi:hypothetical protein [Kitasatospora cheerisanensis]|uniref:Uncharacterized protein n=1 Tax=Kitasatospora cheerisanensis KCTC 2395 TaxID=1348663 RepID=A0A066YLH4_9ACTN|nr:hypothetical protein [Kitasatospora cheerisanensis]KDN82313.1 hypothetical protein KCH_58200 [Kitasatospora cheerisanensis KCTC 2395]
MLLRLYERAEAILDLPGLLDDVEEMLASFRENVFEDSDHELLYDPAVDDVWEGPPAVHPGIAPSGVGEWFVPLPRVIPPTPTLQQPA